jgi:hypothetical protein
MENKRNTISVKVSLVNGGYIDVLDNTDAQEAIEQYLHPDISPPISTYTMTVTDNEGKTVKISIGDGRIFIS